jgi:hypothetical protein
VKQAHVDREGGTGSKAQNEAGAEERRKERKEEVEAKFCGATEDVVGQKGSPGPLGDDFCGDSLQIPEGLEGGARDVVPYALLERVRGFIEGVIGADDDRSLGSSFARGRTVGIDAEGR